MRFAALPLAGAFVVEVEPHEDGRGWLGRTFCAREFAALGLRDRFVQCSLSRTTLAGTLRGLHYQEEPHAEAKLVRCTAGAVHDVLVDLRRTSPTFGRWAAVELTAGNGKSVYVPELVAHGFLTLVDGSEVLYQISEFFHPECAAGVRWDDPAFGIEWPREVRVISERDRGFPFIRP